LRLAALLINQRYQRQEIALLFWSLTSSALSATSAVKFFDFAFICILSFVQFL
jgi:hypothetical protein